MRRKLDLCCCVIVVTIVDLQGWKRAKCQIVCDDMKLDFQSILEECFKRRLDELRGVSWGPRPAVKTLVSSRLRIDGFVLLITRLPLTQAFDNVQEMIRAYDTGYDLHVFHSSDNQEFSFTLDGSRSIKLQVELHWTTETLCDELEKQFQIRENSIIGLRQDTHTAGIRIDTALQLWKRVDRRKPITVCTARAPLRECSTPTRDSSAGVKRKRSPLKDLLNWFSGSPDRSENKQS